jgi:hypothetical protein
MLQLCYSHTSKHKQQAHTAKQVWKQDKVSSEVWGHKRQQPCVTALSPSQHFVLLADPDPFRGSNGQRATTSLT